MAPQCPVSELRVGKKASRITALLVFAALAAAIAAPAAWISLILAPDFLIRGFLRNVKSPFALASKCILAALRLKDTMIDGAPKQFAAKLGFVFSAGMAVLWLCGMAAAANVVAAVFALCAGLEAFFGYCVGCQVYMLLLRFAPSLVRQK